jgi:hypothetical protein
VSSGIELGEVEKNETLQLTNRRPVNHINVTLLLVLASFKRNQWQIC